MRHQHEQRSWHDRFEQWLVKSVVWQRGIEPPRDQPLPDQPVRPEAHPSLQVARAVLGIAIPIAVAVALVPFRTTIEPSSAALVLVLPVVLVALIGGSIPGVVAAVTAALAFDVLLTRPYHSFTINAAADLEAAAVLAVTAVTIAGLVSREMTARTRSTLRHTALADLRAVAQRAAQGNTDALLEAATEAIRDVLRLRNCRWSPRYHGTAGHVLARNGTVGQLRGDLAILPDHVELPVVYDGQELGRLILTTVPGQVVSREERTVAVALADILATGLAPDQRT
jgi:K+-sensing histidine kinase KdpD